MTTIKKIIWLSAYYFKKFRFKFRFCGLQFWDLNLQSFKIYSNIPIRMALMRE